MSNARFGISQSPESQNKQLHASDHYARMSDEYGSHVDQKEYPRGTPYKKNPAIIDTYDPNEKPSKLGEGARASDTYGAHYRDPKYQIPRGGVPLTAHGIPESMDLNETERARARGERNEGAAHAAKSRASGGIGGIDYRGTRPEEYGKFYSNGYDFEGYYQGHHAGKKQQSQFTGAGMIDKDYSDPYEGYRGGVNRLEQKLLPRHNDMDMGVLAYMAPQNREQTIKPKTGAARGRLEAYHTQQRLDKGIGLGDYEKVPEHLKNIGVSKDRMKPRPSEKVMKMLVPEAQEGEYDAGGPSRARGEYHGSANRDNIEVGSVNGMVAKSEAQFDGIFDENRRGPGMRTSTQSRIKFENGVIVAENEAAHDGIFEKPEDGKRAAKKQYAYDATRSSIGFGEGGLIGSREGTNEGIFENAEDGYRKGVTRKQGVQKGGKDENVGAASMKWGREASRGTGMHLTEGGEGIFHEDHTQRGGYAGKVIESSIGPGMAVEADKSIRDHRVRFPGKHSETGFGPGFTLDESKVDDGIFQEGRSNRFAGKDNEDNLTVGPGGIMGKKGATYESVTSEGRTIQHAGADTKSSLRAGPGGFYGDAGTTDEGIFSERNRNKYAGKDAESGIGPGFIPRQNSASDGIFAEGRTFKFAGKDNADGFGPGLIPRKECASDGIFEEGRTVAHAGRDTASAIGSDMMGREDQQQREAFAGAYSELHKDKDTESHFDPGMVPQVQWKGGSGAEAAFNRRQQLQEYYTNAAKATAEGKKLNFYDRNKATEQPAAGLAGNRFSRGGNAKVRTQKTLSSIF